MGFVWTLCYNLTTDGGITAETEEQKNRRLLLQHKLLPDQVFWTKKDTRKPPVEKFSI